jgi:hypothetical protein
LLLHPATPRNISIKFLQDMMIRDLAIIARTVTLHPVLRETAVNYLKLRLDNMRLGEKIALAKTSPVGFLQVLMADKDSRVFRAALSNYRLTEEELLQFLAPSSCSASKLDIVMSDEKWGRNPQVLRLLAYHKNLGYASRRRVFERITIPLLVELTESPVLLANHRKLAHFVAKERIKSYPLKDMIHLAGSPSKKLLFFVGITMEDATVASIWMKNRRVDKEMMLTAGLKNNHPQIRHIIQKALDDLPDNRKDARHD